MAKEQVILSIGGPGKHDCKRTCTAVCWTAVVAVTVTTISRQSWHLWKNQLAEACASLLYTGG